MQGGVSNPVFAPDGRSVAFYSLAEQMLKKIAISGGAAVAICQATNPFGMNWDGDGIVFGQDGRGIMRVSANGGTPELLIPIKDGEVGITRCHTDAACTVVGTPCRGLVPHAFPSQKVDAAIVGDAETATA